jgi:hypothetical protein
MAGGAQAWTRISAGADKAADACREMTGPPLPETGERKPHRDQPRRMLPREGGWCVLVACR